MKSNRKPGRPKDPRGGSCTDPEGKRLIPGARRATNAEIESRINQVVDLLLNGKRRPHVVQFGTNAGWNVCVRQIDKYIAAANDIVIKISKERAENAFDKQVSRLENIYLQQCEAKDFRGARQTLQDIERLLGLTPPTRTETVLMGADGKPIQIERIESRTVEERIALLRELGGIGPPTGGFAVASAVPPPVPPTLSEGPRG